MPGDAMGEGYGLHPLLVQLHGNICSAKVGNKIAGLHGP